MARVERISAVYGSERQPPPYPIGSVDSAVTLMLLVAERGSVKVGEAAQAIDAARSTAYRLLQMLEYRGIVTRDAETKAYVRGPVLLNLGLQALRDFDVRALARPHLERLAKEVDETVHLLVFRGTDVLCVDSIESEKALRVGSRVGMVLSSHVSAAGRALLATLAPERLRQLYPGGRLPQTGELKPTTWRELTDQFDEIRRQGYAMQSGETERGVSSIGVAVVDSLGNPSLGVSVAIPTSRLDETDIDAVVEAARRCSRDIEASVA
jgi:DNA-binding IclR family transcriptional regulator